MLLSLRWRLAATLVLAGVLPAIAVAQKPTAEQAQQILQSRPDLVQQLRQRILSSGLTPDQIRARLRAEGYPENLLDQYLPDSGVSPDSAQVTPDVFGAVVALGIADSTDVSRLKLGLKSPLDSGRLGFDSLRDSLRRDTTATFRLTSSRAFPKGLSKAAFNPDSGYVIFGLDVFDKQTSLFEPNLAGPVDAGYRVGPGDRLVLVLTGDVQSAYTLDVNREGFVVIPQVGEVSVANLTLAQVEDLLYSRLGRVYSGVRRGAGATTHFSITPARLRSVQVFVLGDVEQPGSYRISAASTVLTALYAAGGPTQTGSLRDVDVRRGGKLVGSLDIYDYLLRGDASKDLRVDNGDVVFVRVHGPRIRITGEVLRPATYELKPGETLTDVILAAGGFTARADRRRVQIERVLPPDARNRPGRDRIVMDVPGDPLLESAGQVLPMEAGDVVHVFPVTNRVRNRITVEGDVWAPGSVGLSPGMMLSQALRLAGGVKPDVYLGEVLVSRLENDSSRVQLRTSFRDSSGAPANDMPLLEDDIVHVFSLTEFRPTRYIAIGGAVRKPGRFPYRDGMTLRDLVLLSGGLEERASLQEAEVARLPEDRNGGRLARTIRVPLDSTYIFERAPDGRYLGPPGVPAPMSKAPEVALKPYDNVLILQQPDWNMQRTIVLSGEVRYPGTYALTTKDERIADVLKRAGGLTDVAYADGVFFYRHHGDLGRIGIDLGRVLKEPDYRDNLILQDGDSIHIPQYSAVVNVQGAVNSPVAVSYVPGKDIQFYMDAAGGPTHKADADRAYVTQPNGKVESMHRHAVFFTAKPEPRPGSTVFVPLKDPNDRIDYTAIASSVATIFTSLVAIAVVVIRK